VTVRESSLIVNGLPTTAVAPTLALERVPHRIPHARIVIHNQAGRRVVGRPRGRDRQHRSGGTLELRDGGR
jgi:hypothetical protein